MSELSVESVPLRQRIKASEVLRGTPTIELQDVLENCSGEIEKPVTNLGFGQDGFVLQVPGMPGRTDWCSGPMACKIFWAAESAREKIPAMLGKYPGMEELSGRLNDPVLVDRRESSVRANGVLSSVAGFVVGAEIEPDLIDGRIALVMDGEQPVGYLTPFIQDAKGMDIIDVPGIHSIADRLKRGGVIADLSNTVGDNALRLPDGTCRIIDLAMADHKWETHPRALLGGEIRIAAVPAVVLQRYETIAERRAVVTNYQAAVSRATSGDETFTYNDQLDGTAIVTTKADIQNAEIVSQTIGVVTRQLQRWGLPQEAEKVFTVVVRDDGGFNLAIDYNELGTVSDFAGKSKRNFTRTQLRLDSQGLLEGIWLQYHQATQKVQPHHPPYARKANLGRIYMRPYNFNCEKRGAPLSLDEIKKGLAESDLPEEYGRQFEAAESVDDFCRIATTSAFYSHQEISRGLE